MENTKKFELFLDESGEFNENDLDVTRKPSLIGGLIVPEKTLTLDVAKQICEEQNIHISESNQNAKSLEERQEIASNALKVLGKVHGLENVSFVIWQNNERLQGETPGELYFSMMAQGIANLIEDLSIENQDIPIELKIYISVRVKDPNVRCNSAAEATWSEEEYVKELLNNINIKIAKGDIYFSRKPTIEIETASAKLDHRLMIQDVICNTYLTRDSGKFTREQKMQIKELYKSDYITNINKPNYQKELIKAMSQYNVVDIFFLAFEMKNRKNSESHIQKVINGCIETLENIKSKQLDLQDNLLLTKLETMVNVHGNVKLAEEFLNMIDSKILSKVKNTSPEFNKLKFDVELYNFTVHTHLGKNFEAEKDAHICKEMLENLKTNASLKYIEYYNIVSNRIAVFYINCLDYSSAIDCLDYPILATMLINETLEKITEIEHIKSIELGKLLGTRLQAYTRLVGINENSKEEADKYYELAKQDSEDAIGNFTLQSDIARQCNYRSDLEAEKGNVEESFKFLYKGIMEEEFNNVNAERCIMDLCEKIQKMSNSDSSKFYTICQYVKIMAKAKLIGKQDFANILYNAIKSKKEVINIIEGKKESLISVNNQELTRQINDNKHPFELIYFYYGQFLNDANYINKSIRVCDNCPDELTLQIFAISVRANKYLITLNEKDCKEFLKFAEKVYNENYIDDGNCEEHPTNKMLESIQLDVQKIKSKLEQKNDIKEECKEIIRKIKI